MCRLQWQHPLRGRCMHSVLRGFDMQRSSHCRGAAWLLHGHCRALRCLQMPSYRVVSWWLAWDMCRGTYRRPLHPVPGWPSVEYRCLCRLRSIQPRWLAPCRHRRRGHHSGTLLHNEHEANRQGHHDAGHLVCAGYDDQHASERGHRRLHLLLLASRASMDI